MRMGSPADSTSRWYPLAKPRTPCLAVATWSCQLKVLHRIDGTTLCSQLTVIGSSEGLQGSAGAHEHNSTAFRLLLQIVDSENTCVDDALQIDIQNFICWLLRLSALICL